MLKADQIILYSFYINSQKYSDYIETHIKCLHMYPVTKKTPEYYCKSTNCRSVLIFASFEEVIRQRKIVPSKNCNKRLLMSVLDSSNFNMLTFCILYMINVEYFYQVCFVNFLFCRTDISNLLLQFFEGTIFRCLITSSKEAKISTLRQLVLLQ
jgi:hypothetical protein